MGFSEHDFRHAMGSFITGVTVVTTRTADHQPHGITINSFSSVSLAPALISFCLDNNAHSMAFFKDCQHFAVNILAQEQSSLSHHFAHPTQHGWEEIPYTEGAHSSPLLAGAIAHVECERYATHLAGDHTIFIGKVLNVSHFSDKKPLVYYRGHYNPLL